MSWNWPRSSLSHLDHVLVWLCLVLTTPLVFVSQLSSLVSLSCVQLEPLERVVMDVPFLLMTEVLSSSPWPVLLSTSALQLAPALSEAPAAASQLTGGAAPPPCRCRWRMSCHVCNRAAALLLFLCSGPADRRVCQRVFLPALSTRGQQQQRCSHRTVPALVEEVRTDERRVSLGASITLKEK